MVVNSIECPELVKVLLQYQCVFIKGTHMDGLELIQDVYKNTPEAIALELLPIVVNNNIIDSLFLWSSTKYNHLSMPKLYSHIHKKYYGVNETLDIGILLRHIIHNVDYE